MWEERRKELDKMFEFLVLEKREKEYLKDEIISQEKEMIRDIMKELFKTPDEWLNVYVCKKDANKILKKKKIEEI